MIEKTNKDNQFVRNTLILRTLIKNKIQLIRI